MGKTKGLQVRYFFDHIEIPCNYFNVNDDLNGLLISKILFRNRYKGFPAEGDNTLGRIDIFMLLDLLGTNDPEPTVVSSQQSTHVSL